MKHFASPDFWQHYAQLPAQVQELADKNYALLKDNPQHPSLRFRQVGRYWWVRVGSHYRGLAVELQKECCGFGLVRTPSTIDCYKASSSTICEQIQLIVSNRDCFTSTMSLRTANRYA